MFGILGINKRNLNYVKKWNPNKQIRFAKNKYNTKRFLAQRGIPVPTTYAIIKNRKQLFEYNFENIKFDTFVAKPNKGSKGEGIFIVKKHLKEKEINDSEKTKSKILKKIITQINKRIPHLMNKKNTHPNNYYQVDNKIISQKELKKKLLNIIDGQYTINSNDTILIEEKVEASKVFSIYCEHGLADIRIICFNLVPVAAELRMPTKESGGKANLAQGGIGFGIDIANGKITAMKFKKKIYNKEFPKQFSNYFHKKIPHRDEMLLYSSSVQYFSNIGFLGIDWVITPEGPKILEINARAGLEIQNITLKPLENLMKKIEDLTVTTPEKGVEIAKSLFSSQKTTEIPTAKTIYLSQQGKINYEKNNESGEIDVITTINTKKKRNYISKSLAPKLKQSNQVTLYLNNITIKEPHLRKSEKIRGNRVELGTETIKNFYIKPIHKSKIETSFIKKDAFIQDEIDQIQILDQKISEILKTISISKTLKPINYLDELDKFITRRGKYNPEFRYNFPSHKKLLSWNNDLKKLRDAHKQGTLLQSPFAKLFYEKIHETFIKINMIKAYKAQDLEKIYSKNIELYGEIEEYENPQYPKQQDKDFYEVRYSANRLANKITEYLKLKNYKNVNVVLTPSIAARVNVGLSTNATIKINSTANFSETDLKSIIAHEIETHIVRYQNGKNTGRYLFKKGTAYYEKTEEGLAILNAERELKKHNPQYRNLTIYDNYYLVKKSITHNFQQMTDIIRSQQLFGGKNMTLSELFRKVTRYKKGIQQTKVIHQGATNFKPKIYLDGYLEVKNQKKHKNLYIGKIKFSDFQYINEK